jgi:hypothetical protein
MGAEAGPSEPKTQQLRAEGSQGFRLSRFVGQSLALGAIMMSSLGLYLLVLRWRGPAAAVETQTTWDRQIPFEPGWVWVYLIPYLIGPVIVGLLGRETFLWFVRRGLVLVFVSLVIFMIYPTRTVRPHLTEEQGDGLTGKLYRNMVAIDEPPANAAPSLHVSLTCLLALALIRDFPRWRVVTVVGVGLVWLATLLTWQHHLIDVGTGVLLGSFLALPWPRRFSAISQ